MKNKRRIKDKIMPIKLIYIFNSKYLINIYIQQFFLDYLEDIL